ncbi:MAG: nitroreductase [Rhizobiaceae bacterium]|nr:nitroreductase [Rhizobiaceae bacterium]
MKVSEAIANRISVRAFTNQSVPPEIVESVFKSAARAPSGGNVQPWKIVILGESALADLKTLMAKRLGGEAHPDGEAPEYAVYPQKLKEPYRTARFEVGEDMYGLLGISRDEKPKRLEWFGNNFQFFGAPAAAFCFVDRDMGPPQWSDLGMYLQTVMLLFQEHGIDTCAQECWSFYPRTISDFCNTPDEWMLFCGMAIGYRDETHPVNALRTKRLPTDDWLKIL